MFYQHNINETTKLAVWKIEEEENFFLQHVPLQREITHPHKRLQHLAARYLLRYLFPDFPYKEILIAGTRKPYLPNDRYHFSVSHSGNYAAALVSSDHRTGIDVEMVSGKIRKVMHKFMHENDLLYLNGSYLYDLSPLHLLTIVWSAKEAVFKWYSLGEIDFKEYMQLNGVIIFHNDQLQLPFVFKKDALIPLMICSKIFDELVLSWVITKG
ncbi:MAG TPA: 4'-phosphopantetheinyl transferase superfamily protein [Chitinophagaceae bacterium]